MECFKRYQDGSREISAVCGERLRDILRNYNKCMTYSVNLSMREVIGY